MRDTFALIAAAFLCWNASACRPQCREANDCLEPNQCNGAPNLMRYAIASGAYRVVQSDVGLDGCLIGRRNGDLDGLGVDLVADEAAESIALSIGNNLDLGSGKRNPQPSCNSASLSRSGVAGNLGGCTYTAAFSSQLVLLENSEFYLSITEEHTDLTGTCPVQTKSCILLYGATVR